MFFLGGYKGLIAAAFCHINGINSLLANLPARRPFKISQSKPSVWWGRERGELEGIRERQPHVQVCPTSVTALTLAPLVSRGTRISCVLTVGAGSSRITEN